MQLTGYEDLRVQRTIKSIYNAFESLILEKDYSKITVKELAQRAQINKKTFYRYYPTLDDLLSEMQTQLSSEYIEQIKNYHYPQDLDKSVQTFFEFSANQGPAYDKITVNTHYSKIRQEMINNVMSHTWSSSPSFNKLSDWEKQALLTFVQNTGLAVYRSWIEGGRTTDLKQVTDTAIKLMHGGVERFLGIKF